MPNGSLFRPRLDRPLPIPVRPSLYLAHRSKRSIRGACRLLALVLDCGVRETVYPPEEALLKVIGAGFGRTGTMSLKVALEELAFGPCYHMSETAVNPGHDEAWSRAAAGKEIDWEWLFQKYHAAVDWPACAFYERLMSIYPDARVILTVRDPDRWYESVFKTIYQPSKQRQAARLNEPPDEEVSPEVRARRAHGRMVDRVVWQGTFQGRLEDRDFAIGVYLRHNADVKRKVPPERLLVYEVAQGWEPLGAFLRVDVPKDRAFPHLNDTASFLQQNPTERRLEEARRSSGKP